MEDENRPLTGIVTASSLNLRSTPDGSVLKKLPSGTVVQIIDDAGEWLKVLADGQTGFVSSKFIKRQKTDGGIPGTGGFRFFGNHAIAPDGTRFARKFKLGVYNLGKTSIGDFIARHAEKFPSIHPCQLRVMAAVSKNEGNLEAINTWDNSFLTFGIFQWTVGAGSAAGELAALMTRLNQANPAAFEKFFGQYGLDVSKCDSESGGPPCGFFSFKGAELKTAVDKERLRSLEWAYRFWISGSDESVCRTQIEHALSR